MYEFHLDLAPLSLNSAYYGMKFRRKKESTFEWEATLSTLLRTYDKNIKAIKKKHRCAKTFLIPNYLFYLDRFYTKKGNIHQRAGDYDNFIKLSNDVLADVLEVDDSCFIGGYNFKLPAKKSKIVLRIEIGQLDDLNNPDYISSLTNRRTP